MFDKMIGSVFRRADQAHKEHMADRAKTLDASTRALIGMAKAMLAAKACGEDQIATVERVLGWERLNTLVAEVDKVVTVTREDSERDRRSFSNGAPHGPLLLGAFVFRSWQAGDSALDALRDLCTTGGRNLPSSTTTAFLKPTWRKLVGTGIDVDRRAYEVAVMMTLCDRLRSGDIWVEGSRAFRPFDDFLLPPEIFEARQRKRKDELGLAVSGRFDEWRADRVGLLESRLQEIDAIAAAGKLADAVITEEGLSISPIRKDETDESEGIARRLYGMLPRLRITELLAEVHGWIRIRNPSLPSSAPHRGRYFSQTPSNWQRSLQPSHKWSK
jgi:hypothetical protein